MPPGVRVDGLTIADVLGLSVNDALRLFANQGDRRRRPPAHSGGRTGLTCGSGSPRRRSPGRIAASRIRLPSLRSSQRGALYVFDEPSTGLHPLDVASWVSGVDRLLDAGATIIVIDHDLDLLAAADHMIDMGPGGGPDGGRIGATGTPERGDTFPRTA